MKELLDIAAKVKARNAVLPSIPGSGFHPNDLCNDPRRPESQGRLKVKDHVVFFHRKHDAVFVGDDAQRCYDALKELYDARAAYWAAAVTPDEKKMLTVFEDVTLSEQDGVPVLSCPLDEWNILLPALAACGIGVSGAAPDGSSLKGLGFPQE